MPDQLSLTFSALADPTRREIIEILSRGDANVNEIAKPFLNEMSLPAITKHLKVLEKAGLITKTKDAQFRTCRINPEPLNEIKEWMEHYRVMMEEGLDRLDEYLMSLQNKNNKKNKGSKNAKGK